MASAKEFVQLPCIEVLHIFLKKYVNVDSTRSAVTVGKVNVNMNLKGLLLS